MTPKREGTCLWHRKLALEPTSNPVINTLWFPPCLLDTLVTVRLVTPMWIMRELTKSANSPCNLLEVLGAFLDDRDLDHGGLSG